MPTAKKLPSGNYRVQAYDYTEIKADGKKKHHYKSFTAEKKSEAEYQASLFSIDKDASKKPENMTLGQAVDKYIASHDGILSPTTLSGYKKMSRNHFQSMMGIPLDKLDINLINAAINEEAKRPTRTGKPLSPKSLRNAWGFIASVLNVYRPSFQPKVSLPAKDDNELIELLPVEIIMQVVEGTSIELAVHLAMWLSFSASEVRGLTKSKSIIGDYIHVKEVVVDVEKKVIRKKQAKVNTRKRALKIPPYIQYLIDQTDPNDDVLVPLTGRMLYKRFVALLKKNNLPHMSFHRLRHVNASVMEALNIPKKYRLARGGWRSEQVMDNIYTHTFTPEREKADNQVDDYMEGKRQLAVQNASQK